MQCLVQSLLCKDNHWWKIDGLNKRNKGENEKQRKRENGSARFLSLRILTHFPHFLLRFQETDNHVCPNYLQTCSGRGHGASHFSRDETKAGRRESLTITKAHEPRLVAESGQWFFLPARTSYPSPCEALAPFLGSLKARPVGLCFQHEEKPSNPPQKLRCPCTPCQPPSKHPRGSFLPSFLPFLLSPSFSPFFLHLFLSLGYRISVNMSFIFHFLNVGTEPGMGNRWISTIK